MENKRTVLIVEDNDLNRDILAAMLEDEYEILTADNGKTGLDILMEKGRGIDTVLLDIQMPVMDGYEFLLAIKENGQYTDIPVIVTTASGSMTNEIRCLDLGASDFISKPYNADVVKKRIRSLIRLKETSAMLHRVEYDSLTGLYIREFFFEYVSERLRKDPDGKYDIVCSEIYSYDLLAERYGDEKLDELTKYLAMHLVADVPDKAICGRINPDVFALLLPHADIDVHTERMREYFGNMEDIPIPNVMVKAGVYANVGHDQSVKVMCDNAIMAIGKIRNLYGVYTAEYDDKIRSERRMKQTLAECMEQSLENGEFKVYYQPKYNLKKKRVGGAEALVRWIHPKLGFIMPGIFIPLFEQNGFVYELDTYMLKEVSRAQREWLDCGYEPVPVSVNISRADFDVPDLDAKLELIVDKFDVPHDLIHFEVTESAYSSDPHKILSVVQGLRDRGFLIELDDFGSGYSSLNVINDMTIDILKIDMSLVKDMLKPRNKKVLESVMALADNLGMDIVAEGVETKEQADGLLESAPNRAGVFAQGFYYSKPIPKEEFLEYMHRARAQEKTETAAPYAK